MKKKNYWFRICFEKEFEDERDAEDFLEETTNEIFHSDITDMSSEFEERKKFVKEDSAP